MKSWNPLDLGKHKAEQHMEWAAITVRGNTGFQDQSIPLQSPMDWEIGQHPLEDTYQVWFIIRGK